MAAENEEVLLGLGSFGAVFPYGEDGTCVKKVMKTGSFSAVREAEVLRPLKGKHPHIVQMVMELTQGKQTWLILERADCDLETFLQTPAVTASSRPMICRLLIRQIFSAIAFCHEKGLIHTDVKGPNILVFGGSHFVLADFGACEYVAPIEEPDRTTTCTFRAPELLAMQTNCCAKIDVWSMGVVCYNMLHVELRLFPRTVPCQPLCLLHHLTELFGAPNYQSPRLPFPLAYWNSRGKVYSPGEGPSPCEVLDFDESFDPAIAAVLDAALVLLPAQRASAAAICDLFEKRVAEVAAEKTRRPASPAPASPKSDAEGV